MQSAVRVDLTFARSWEADILISRPPILPARRYVYPVEVEEVERGALEILIRPKVGGDFLATCALGFKDPIVPTGIWSAANPDEICAVAGGYVYMVDTTAPERFTMLPYRPVLNVYPAPDANVLLFVGHRSILAWGAHGEAWQSPKLSDEGVTVNSIERCTLHGAGWNLITDEETPFALDLQSGALKTP